MTEALHSSDLAPGLLLGGGVVLGEDVRLGANVVIHDGVSVGSGAIIADGAVIGKQPTLGGRSSARRSQTALATAIGEDAAVLTGSIVFAGAEIGAGTIVGDQAHVRERARIGAGTVIGRGAAIDNDVRIGERVRVQTNCYVTAGTLIEDDAFLGPGVITTNDDTMARQPAGAPLLGATIRRAARVGGGAVLCPGVEVGEEAFVAAGAVVAADVAARTVVMGVPARAVREVGEGELIEAWRQG